MIKHFDEREYIQLASPVSWGDTENLYLGFLELENYSIQKACEGITEEELKKLEWATDKLQQAINSNDRIAASRANIEFHRLLYSYSRNTFLQKTTDSLWLSFRISFLSARNEWLINLVMRNETTSTYR
ncbi:FCD domain-containing protein [Peribacillus sp. NPDC096447]|uniref:FCD domain-containing protein n=1 Tax=Peribacillus sp. NPDC096447 TaxID=3364394 RepID=UPI00382B3B82